jgi:hypothetical protein
MEFSVSKVVDFFISSKVVETDNLFVLIEEQIENQCRREQRNHFKLMERFVVGSISLRASFGNVVVQQIGLIAVTFKLIVALIRDLESR